MNIFFSFRQIFLVLLVIVTFTGQAYLRICFVRFQCYGFKCLPYQVEFVSIIKMETLFVFYLLQLLCILNLMNRLSELIVR